MGNFKIALLVLFGLVCTSCDGLDPVEDKDINQIPEENQLLIIEKQRIMNNIYKMEIEGHSYIVVKDNDMFGITHNENCHCKIEQKEESPYLSTEDYFKDLY